MLRHLLPTSLTGWGVVVLAAALGLSMGKNTHLEERVTILENDNAALSAMLEAARRSEHALAGQAAELQLLLQQSKNFAAERAAIISEAKIVTVPKTEEAGHGLDRKSSRRVVHHIDDAFARLRP